MDVTTVKKEEAITTPMELTLDIKPSASTSRHQSTTTTSHQSQSSSIEFNHLSQLIEEEEEEEEVPDSSQDTHSNNISTTIPEEHQYNTYQTVSIKLPHNMAVLLVPVNLTSVTDDDAMQLQQLGKRVAIVRGSMTNVAEFQVLPAMTFDAQSKILGMETDIRQIVINEGGGGEEARGPTIQITPQIIESADQETIIDEVVTITLPQETPPTIVHQEVEEKEVVPDPPPKPKRHVYIEAIRCGRCLQEFADLVELSGHQKKEHANMMVIEVGSSHTGETPQDSLRPDLYEQALSMDDKILARLAKNEEAKLRKLMQANVRGSGSGSNAGNNINKAKKVASRGGVARGAMSKTGGGVVLSGAVGRGKNATRGAFVRGSIKTLNCHVCSLSFTDARVYNAHLKSHHSAVAVQDGQEFNSSFNEYVEEEEAEVVELVEADTERKGGRKYSIVSTPYKTGQAEHIITDGAGNHILVHADTPDQLQELIVSLESGTLQMVNGGAQGDGSTTTGVYVLEDTEEKA